MRISKECITIHFCYDILCTALFKALFHVPLLYFEHLPLERSLHGPAPHTDVSRNLATVVVRGILPGLRRRTGLLPSGPKSSFQMRASFVFNLENKVLESGGRVEKLIAQVAWSPVLSFHSLWWFGVQCHLLVLVHCTRLPKKFWSTSCFLLLTSFLKMLISFSSRIWHLPTLPNVPKVG